ncbi:MAG: UDP-N-acetylmuramoyl-L-alanyl-D-glutamate--2,6-diaminopimelate ligase [Clostridia bacterium]|nr:UDP-N-acetylmuramoyl-L-alanyl-D-glutamate--2,6-diaminopimelate ligase [Clostridia bacterium]
MKLKELMVDIDYRGELCAQTEITALCRDSRKVTPGCAFVCIAGTGVDSHAFAEMAAQAGAAVIIAERDVGLPQQLLVKSTRFAWAVMCANWFHRPTEQLKLVGVTGTNGKTSTSYLLKAVLEQAGHRVGLIGTIQNMIGDRVVETKHTTPDSYELQELFAQMADAGCEYAVMEVSSHALDQERVAGCRFEAGVFTNLTQDHLDYHKTMENYAAAKKRLFSHCKTAVLNKDDAWYPVMSEGVSCQTVTFSTQDNDADYTARYVRCRPDGVDFECVGVGVIGRIRLATPGRFSAYNALAAAACASALGIPFDTIKTALCGVGLVKGRAEVVPTGQDFTVIIDFAHTPDGLENICETLNTCKAGRLITVFGCGGDRDRTKRPKMGAMAARLSDFVVVTSDNPRSEDPQAIINDILEGMQETETPYTVVPSRVEAITWAIQHAQTGDTVLLAGKGHETYQILKDQTIHFDEREVVATALQERSKKVDK